MAENLSFVPTLGTPEEFIPNLGDILPGTHTDCILKESLRPIESYGQTPRSEPNQIFGLFTSFPDILPEAGQDLLARSEAIFTRSEFLALRAVGDQVVNLPLSGWNADRFSQVIEDVAAAAPQTIYHRMIDYNPEEFDFLAGQSGSQLRGSGKLLTDEALLEHELEIIRGWKGAGKIVRVILPYISTPDEQASMQEVVSEVEPDEIGVMVERVEHAEDIDDYPLADFVVPGPSDLTADLVGSRRADYRDGDETTEQRIIDLSQRVADLIGGQAYMVTVKFLVGKIVNRRVSDSTRSVYMPSQLIDQVA